MININHFGPVTRFDLARTLAGRGRYWTTAYLVDGFLIDSGCAFTAIELSQILASTNLSHIVNTHSHEDHIGGNGRLKRQFPDLTISAHPDALPVLSNPSMAQPLHPYRRLFWGWPEPSSAQEVADDQVIQTENNRFQVIYTPGHSPDHICLFEPDQGWLFSGDLFVGGKDKALRDGYNIWQIIESLKKIALLPISTLFPGSARVRSEPHQALSDKISYLEDLGSRVLALDRQGTCTNDIILRLLGKPQFIEWVTLGHFSRRHLILSFLLNK